MNSFSLAMILLLLAAGGGNACLVPESREEPAAPELSPSPAAAPKQNGSMVEYMDPTLPPLFPAQIPKCSLHLLHHQFGNSIGAPPITADYTPPTGCPAPWSRVVLELSASASDVQSDRIAAIWLDGAEILRTTTPLPLSPGVFWRVRKDVTRYTALLRRRDAGSAPGVFSMMLENSNATFPGVYTVNVSLHFYRGALCGGAAAKLETTPISAHPTIKGLYREPADLIIPISRADGEAAGFWFTVRNESEPQVATVTIPNNTYRAVLEMYASHHGDDEYWYVNPLRSTGGSKSNKIQAASANGGFRQVVATVDGRYVGSAVPFPVIYPGSINPFFWAPVAAIGVYDHPSYDVDLTPFVGQLIDGRPHEFGLTVRDCQPHWLVSGNLHLWLDAWSDEVQGALVRYKVPPLEMSRQADWKHRDGKSEVEGAVIIRFSGWVSSSKGNITTSVRHKLKFKSHIEVEDKGATKTVELENKARTTIRIEKDDEVVGRVLVDTESPLQLMSTNSNGGGRTTLQKTKMVHGLMETRSVEAGKAAAFNTVADRQESEGSVLMQDGAAMWGKGDTKSIYKYRDNKACYLRTVSTVGGKVKEDVNSASCAMAVLPSSSSSSSSSSS